MDFKKIVLSIAQCDGEDTIASYGLLYNNRTESVISVPVSR